MANLIEMIYEKVMEKESGRTFFSFIQGNYHSNEYSFISDILAGHFQNEDPEKVVSYTRTKKLLRRKADWYEKSTNGYEEYKKTGKTKRGIYRHIVDFLFDLEKIQKQKGPVLFEKMTDASTPVMALNRVLVELDRWEQSEDVLLIQYPFFSFFGDKLKEKSIEVDGILLIGEALVVVIKNQDTLSFQSNGEDRIDLLNEETYIKKMPSIFLDTPFSAIGDKAKYELDEEDVVSTQEEILMGIKKKHKHELPEDHRIYINEKMALAVKGKQIKTPNMADELLFIEMLEHRDVDFQKNKKIFIYLSDLIEEFYDSDNAKNYGSLRNRLLSLGMFRVAKVLDNGGFRIRSLFHSMDVDQDETGRWFVRGVVSDEIRDIILRDNFVKIYNEKINELTSPLSMHLSFLVQKERILHHQKGKDMITFRLTWADFIGTIRMNKRSKRENMKEIGHALSEIREKDFLIHSFLRDSDSSFLLNCYNLNDHELKDRASIRSIFSKTLGDQLLENTIEAK